MDDEQRLLERLRLVEALHAGAATPGERDAAANARARILERLRQFEAVAPPVEYRFTTTDPWSRRLLVALLRRYGIRPYRLRGQRHSTVMAKVSAQFVDETLWPEYLALSRELRGYLDETANRIIGKAINPDASEPEDRAEPDLIAGSE